jgi:hypothetical protein
MSGTIFDIWDHRICITIIAPFLLREMRGNSTGFGVKSLIKIIFFIYIFWGFGDYFQHDYICCFGDLGMVNYWGGGV